MRIRRFEIDLQPHLKHQNFVFFIQTIFLANLKPSSRVFSCAILFNRPDEKVYQKVKKIVAELKIFILD